MPEEQRLEAPEGSLTVEAREAELRSLTVEDRISILEKKIDEQNRAINEIISGLAESIFAQLTILQKKFKDSEQI